MGWFRWLSLLGYIHSCMLMLHSQPSACSSFPFSFFLNQSSSFAAATAVVAAAGHRLLCPHEEGFALLQFSQLFSIDDLFAPSECQRGHASHAKTLSWKEGSDCCNWHGVTCDYVTGHVVALDLSCSLLFLNSNNINGSSLFSLHHLRKLNLSRNNFNGSQISPEFGLTLTSLTHLNLSDSAFAGPVPPELSHLSELVSLDLSYNLLTFEARSFKTLLQNLTEIRELFLNGIDLSGNSFANLSSTSLTSLRLSKTELQGEFPFGDNILRLPKLEVLDVSGNPNLTGHFPPNVVNMTSSLTYLDLSSCSFSGPIPTFLLGNLTKLTYLDLSHNNFVDQIPDSFANLENLTILRLNDNNFSGEFPSSTSNLSQLEEFDLSNNQLTGALPSQVSGFSNLILLDLQNNSLNGLIPTWLFALPSLLHLYLSQNQLTGPIHEFQSFAFEEIYLSNNQLSGPIPNSISKLHNLTRLYISSNNLDGILDLNSFSNLKELIVIDLSYNKNLSLNDTNFISLPLPNLSELYLSSCNITKFPNLKGLETLGSLDLSVNKISGDIPKWTFNMWNYSLSYLNLSFNFLTRLNQQLLPWNNLQFLDLQTNLIHGELPIPPPSMSFYSFSNNKLTGEIPSFFCNASYLEVLDLSDNSLGGTIPPCLVNFSYRLQVLNLHMNQFHGTIPDNFPEGSHTSPFLLRNLGLNDNRLEGPMPRSMVNCLNLEVLDIGNNKIDDTFPYWLESLPQLHVLVMRSNKFHGDIVSTSKTQVSFPKLRVIDCSSNHFTGLLPSKYFESWTDMMNVDEFKYRLSYIGGPEYYQDSIMVTIKGSEIQMEKIQIIFTVIDMSNNNFRGKIPTNIGKFKSLRGLNFSHNNLAGDIPLSVGNLIALEWLDLSSNKLRGEIPKQLIGLSSLAVLNLSQNQLSGSIPHGSQLDTFSNSSYSGNLGLCGFPLSKTCTNDNTTEPPSFMFQQDNNSHLISGSFWEATLIGYGFGIVVGLVVGYLMFITRKPNWLVKGVEGVGQKKVKRLRRSTYRRGRGM
ncbi:receptor-like protein 53 [Malania oleifera]|uniref:receptor-like protein 53 n=1 Tax=Malania oleifera TaxID=397392 RepID=UPI0025ADF588|nr:receptor-like protein 53 [Malania oleifera]